MTALLAFAIAAVASAGPSADDLLRDESGRAGAGLEPLHFTRTDWDPDRIAFTFRTEDGARVVFVLTRPDPERKSGAAPRARLARYDVDWTVEPAGLEASLADPIAAVVRRLESRQEAGPDLRRVRAANSSRAPPGGDATGSGMQRRDSGTDPAFRPVPEAERTRVLELGLSFALLAVAALALPFLFLAAARALRDGPRLAVPASLLAVAVVQLLVPWRLVMVFAGYGLVRDAWNLVPIVKYGAATTAVYGPLLRLFGPEVEVVQAANLVFGLLAVPIGAALARRLSPSRHAGWTAVLLLGLLPAFLRDRVSESILVPASFFVLASLLHLDAFLRKELDRSRGRLERLAHAAGAAAHAGLAMNARPEALAVLPLLAFGVFALEGRLGALRRPGVVATLVVAAFTAIPRLVALSEYAGAARLAGDVPGLADDGAAGLVTRFFELNALWLPEVHPLAATVLGFAAPLLLPRRRRLAAVFALAAVLLWQALSTYDLPPVSVPRVQAPALLWTALLAATSIAALLDAASRLWRGAGLAALGLSLVPSPAAVDHLFAETNAQAFHAFTRRAFAAQPSGETPLCVVALAMSDPPADIVIREYPVEALLARAPSVSRFSIETFLESPDAVLREGCAPLYLEGPQCRARFRGFGAEPPEDDSGSAENDSGSAGNDSGSRPLPLCAAMHARFHLEPVHAEDQPNRGNRDFPFWDDRTPTLRYGLYRIGSPARPESPGPP